MTEFFNCSARPGGLILDKSSIILTIERIDSLLFSDIDDSYSQHIDRKAPMTSMLRTAMLMAGLTGS